MEVSLASELNSLQRFLGTGDPMGSISAGVGAAKASGSGRSRGAALERLNPGVRSCSLELSQLC